jgi:hypothetical protein
MNDTAYQQAAAQLEHIEALMAALEVDFHRLAELEELESGKHLDGSELDELAELKAAANGCEDTEDALRVIVEYPLSVEVRSGWKMLGETLEPEEFSILLCTGGPAVRIMGELDHNGDPGRAWLEYQDWGTPWTHFVGGSDVLVRFACNFIFDF